MKYYLVLCLVLNFFSCKSQEKTEWKNLDSLVNSELKEKNIPAISIGIVKNGEILLLKGYGFADYENKVLADETTIYQIGSVTKTLTGHLLAKMIIEGKIKLTDTVSNFFPENLDFPKYPNGDRILVKELATHSAEFPRYPSNLKRVDPNPIKGYSYEEMLEGIESVTIDTLGGHRYNYSNFGYGVLGTALENLSKKTLEELFESNIFSPYKMTNTSLKLSKKVKQKLAMPYLETNPLVKTEPWDMGKLSGAGNIFSSVSDMSKFLQAIMQNNETNKTQQTGLLKINENWQYGLGCFIIDSKKKNTTIIYHGGDVDGYASSLKYYPEYQLGTIILTNYGEGRIVSETFSRIEDLIFEKLKSQK